LPVQVQFIPPKALKTEDEILEYSTKEMERMESMGIGLTRAIQLIIRANNAKFPIENLRAKWNETPIRTMDDAIICLCKIYDIPSNRGCIRRLKDTPKLPKTVTSYRTASDHLRLFIRMQMQHITTERCSLKWGKIKDI